MRRLPLPILAALAALYLLLLFAAIPTFGVGVVAAALVPLSLVPWVFGARVGVVSALVLATVYHFAFGLLLPESERVEGQRLAWFGVPFAFAFAVAVAHVRGLQRRLEDLNAALARAALTDVLTGLPNRRALEADLDRAVTQRPGEFALVLVDVDGLKAVNDTQGHARGDALLQAFGAGFGRTFGPDGRVYRLSGDEFAVLLNEVGEGSVPEAVETVLAVARAVGVEFPGAGASAGGSVHQPGMSASALLIAADHAMYAHKRRPREELECGATAGQSAAVGGARADEAPHAVA
ncbi:GGDEF domain-containing protein [Deinococcus sp. YIM 134068]|uniref:GGDEF domain-containing protein n=1 Tax=Deinococcus lichenicola TaxID=3118910 RepID=UPI002F9240D0